MKMTKKQVVSLCREIFRDNPETFRGDTPAKREYFNNFTDGLAKDGIITPSQYARWSNPF